jgi:hypothetical protein
MKVLSVTEVNLQEENRNRFPFFASSPEGSIIMFVSATCGIAIKHTNSSSVGRLIDGWISLHKRNSDGNYYWKPYHGQITIEV